MGNTQYSLLSGQLQEGKPERNKSSSPMPMTRGLLTSKSPERRDEHHHHQSNSPYKKMNTDLKPSSSLRSKMKNSNTSKQSPVKGQGIQKYQYPQLTNKVRSETDYHQMEPKDFRTEVRSPGAVVISDNMFPNSTKTENKRFTFDTKDINAQMQKALRRSQLIHDLEEHDIKILVYYDYTKYVEVGWNSGHKTLDIGWLVSEILRQLSKQDDFNKRTQIIGLKNMNTKASECYDYMLTQIDSNISFIKNAPQEKFSIGSMGSFSPINSDILLSPMSTQLTLEDFELVKVIGKGGFSKVFQGKIFKFNSQLLKVRKRDTGKLYAMKTLSKAKIKRDNKVENILNERTILEQVSHPFIIQMKYAFQNEDYLFLLLEFCAGGELFFRLNNIPQGKMNEKQAKFYFAEILEAIQYLHDNNILYRDLKPENIVIDEKGHVRLTDFGLSKVEFRLGDRAYSFCGSPEYMAPEMLVTERNRMLGNAPMYHARSLDFYHLGALLFEMVCGLPPFFSEDREKMYKDIMFSALQIPAYLSNECRSLLKGLLKKNPAQRLGSKNGAREIKDHPWMKDIEWDKLLRKEISPPFKPFMNKSNFDPEYTSMDPILQDDEPLIPLSDFDQDESQKVGQMYENFDSKATKNIYMDKLIRQPSIELYERENHTFRGYSFLQENYYQPLPHGGNFDPDVFFFCLPESKDQSFSGLQEFEHASGDMVNGNNMNENNEQLMMMMFATESKNKQSQLSILSEGIDTMKANLNTMGSRALPSEKLPTRVMHSQQNNELLKGGYLKHQQSKESLFNELTSTFDYSIQKKDKNIDQIKKANNTQSTMSLFSNNQHQQYNVPGHQYFQNAQNEIFDNKLKPKQLVEPPKEEKMSLKEKLEFNKQNRKYSPEIDLNRALMQAQNKRPSQLKYHKQLTSTNKDQIQRPQSNLRNQAPQKDKKKTIVGTTSPNEYSQLGGMGPLQKKRQSELTHLSVVSSESQRNSNLRGSINKASRPSNYNNYSNANSKTSKQQPQQQTSQFSSLKTSQLYTHVHSKMTGRKSRNLPSQSTQNIKTNEECKIESNYQTLQSPNLMTESTGKFIVKQITANDFLGSFYTQNSNGGKEIIFKDGEKQNMTEEQREAVTAIILNQSHESCCCSDDEFNTKSNSNLNQQSQKNLKRLQYNALQDSIQANQNKHKANDVKFKSDIQSMKHVELERSVKQSFMQQDLLDEQTSPVHVEETYDKDNLSKAFKSNNPSLLDHGALDRAGSLLVKPTLSTQKLAISSMVSKLTSPTNQSQSLLNKTINISPLRGAGSSRLKERPSLKKTNNVGKEGNSGFGLQLSNTPKSKEAKGAGMQNKLAQTVTRIARNGGSTKE